MPTEIGNFESKVHPRDIQLKRTIQAPRKLVFEAFTQPEHLVHFWAPKPWTTHNCKVDLRPGGKWTYTFRSPDGQEHNSEHTYLEVDPPKKLVMTADVPGPGGKPFFRLRQTILLEEKNGVTELVMQGKVLEANEGSEPFLGGMEQGTNMTLDQMIEYLGTLKAKG